MFALSLAGLLTVAASFARADETSQGRALLAGGIVADAGSLAMAGACGGLFTEDIGRAIDNPGPEDGHTFAAIVATCTLNVALGIAGTALTVAGAKKLERGRALHYSLNSLTVRF